MRPNRARERLPRGSLSRALFGRMSRPGHPPRYPTPKSPPSGRGLGGKSRRSPAGSVASLRKCFDSRSIQHQMGPYTHAAEASFSSIQFPLPPAIFQGTVSEGGYKTSDGKGYLNPSLLPIPSIQVFNTETVPFAIAARGHRCYSHSTAPGFPYQPSKAPRFGVWTNSQKERS